MFVEFQQIINNYGEIIDKNCIESFLPSERRAKYFGLPIIILC